ncbi:hypothetical protein HDK90DRAFT_515539 [Phyllosticta capitalensis]|uniref:DUF7730 domain-containing protein n=1 Tax=Phyllosticta capitalensis TaxID=121624 RepID=A0ABR1YAB6_9PEZI
MPTTRFLRERKSSGALDISNHAKHVCRKDDAPDPSIPPRHGCPFLDLPQELRDHIYGFALVVGVIRVDPVFEEKCSELSCNENVQEEDGIYDFSIHEHATSRHVAMGLLQTCRQVFEESECILYSKNTFFFCNDCRDPYSILKVNAFFASLPPRAMSWVKSVKIQTSVKVSIYNPTRRPHLMERMRGDMAQFRRTFAECLPALEHASVIVADWPGNLRLLRCIKESLIVSGCPNVIGILLLLPKFKRFSMEIQAHHIANCRSFAHPDPRVWATEIACSLVASAALIRSHVLRNGDRLGTANVVMHKRHYAQYVYPIGRPDTAVIRRLPGKCVCVARCDDDETGKSFLKAAERPSPLWANKNHWKDLLGPQLDHRQQLHRGFTTASNVWDKPPPDPQMDVPDYAESDDGDNDSLNELDLSGCDVQPVALHDEVIPLDAVIPLMEETLDGKIGVWN